jgi:hypothetical protein
MAKAKASGREFTASSWNGVVSKIAAAYHLTTTAGERVAAARDLEDGETAVLDGTGIRPVSG